MSPRTKSLARLLGGAVLISGLAACAGHHHVSVNQQYVEEPVEELYGRGSTLLDQKQWTEAITAFEEVERQHPYSSWARRAMLMEAYANYQANKYDAAIDDAQRFLALHPGNESAPYAYYLIAVCQFERILDVGRDQGTTERALTALQDVVRRYPDSDYARDARIKVDMVYDQLAGKEMEIGRFYEHQDQHLAAINRFRNVIENPNYQRTTHTPEALYRLVECYISVGMVDQAQRMAAVLGYNFPGSEWYQRAYALLTQRGVTPVSQSEAQHRGWLTRTFDHIF